MPSFAELIAANAAIAAKAPRRTASMVRDNFGGVFCGPAVVSMLDGSISDALIEIVNTREADSRQLSERIADLDILTLDDFAGEAPAVVEPGTEREALVAILMKRRHDQLVSLFSETLTRRNRNAGSVGDTILVCRQGANVAIYEGILRIAKRVESVRQSGKRPVEQAYLFEPQWDQGFKPVITEALLWLSQQAAAAGNTDAENRIGIALDAVASSASAETGSLFAANS